MARSDMVEGALPIPGAGPRAPSTTDFVGGPPPRAGEDQEIFSITSSETS